MAAQGIEFRMLFTPERSTELCVDATRAPASAAALRRSTWGTKLKVKADSGTVAMYDHSKEVAPGAADVGRVRFPVGPLPRYKRGGPAGFSKLSAGLQDLIRNDHTWNYHEDGMARGDHKCDTRAIRRGSPFPKFEDRHSCVHSAPET